MSPPLLLRAALLLTCSALALSAQSPDCPPCGSTKVPYPLSTNPNCGDPSYPITCKDNNLYLKSTNYTYLITAINPSDQRLVVHPSSLVPGSCNSTDLPQNGLQLERGGKFKITVSNTIFYINCNKNIFRSPLNCSTNNLCHTYIGSDSPCAKTICCDFKASGSPMTAYRIRLEEGRCRAYMSFVNLDPNLPVEKWHLSSGVELQWASPAKSTAAGG